MSGIVGSRLNIRGSGIVGGIGTDGQVLTSSGAGQEMVFEDAGGGAVTAINNATANELVSIGATTTELDAESGLTYTDGALVLGGTTPTLTIGDAGAEDTKIIFDGNAQDYYIGLSDGSDALKIGLGSTLGTTMSVNLDAAGIMTRPLHPAFAVRNSAVMYVAIAGNQTIQFDTEIFDVNADFNTGTYTFTAPVTGKYLLVSRIDLVSPQDASNSAQQHLLYYTTSNRTYEIHHSGFPTDTRRYSESSSVVADMDANDTAYMRIYMRNGTASVSFLEAGDFTRSTFSGFLI